MARTVTERTEYESKPEMSAVGYALAGAAALVMLPLLPFVALVWLLVGRNRDESPTGARRGGTTGGP